MSINRFHDIEREVRSALAAGYPLTVEYDAGEITLHGDDLRQAWEDMTLDDPFTIATVHDNLTPAQLAAVTNTGGEFHPTATHPTDETAWFVDSDARGCGFEVRAWWSPVNPGQLVLQIDTRFEPNDSDFRVMLNDAVLFNNRPRRED